MALFILFCTILYSTVCHSVRPTLSSNPNIIFIVADDLPYTRTWSNLGLAPEGTSLKDKTVRYLGIPTPNIDALMDESVVIPRTYSAGTLCSPSRYSLLTGRQAVRCGFAEERTLSLPAFDETLGTYVSVPFVKIDSDADNTYNLAAVLSSTLSYRTGMFGKWHLTEDNKGGLSCTTLNSEQSATLYDDCITFVSQAGFTTVDAFYFGNIEENVYFSHNPEWKIYAAKQFITSANTANEPFFAYIGLTLAHDATDAYAALQDTDGYLDTPKGQLTEYDSGMQSRSQLFTRVETVIGNIPSAITPSDKDKKIIASTIWIDDAVGELISHLKSLDIYDNTFFVFANDHGTGAKGTLFEQGTRQLQVIRFPEYWSLTSSYIAPDSFITSNVDLAAVIYDMLGIADDPALGDYVIDGISWIDDLFDRMDGETTSTPAERYCDTFNSKAIMRDDDLTYIYSPGDKGMGMAAAYYEYASDIEQLYDLTGDPNEQINVLDDASYAVDLAEFRTLMDTYIKDKACPDGITCETPLTTSLARSMAKSSYFQRDFKNNDSFLKVVFFVSAVCIALMLYCVYRVKKVKIISNDHENTPLLYKI